MANMKKLFGAPSSSRLVAVTALFVSLTSAAAAEAGTLTFDTGNLMCDGQTSLDVDVTNTSTTSIPSGTAVLGSFTGHYAGLAPGASLSIPLTSSTPWSCNAAPVSFVFKTGAGKWILPGERETTEVEISFFPELEAGNVHVVGDPNVQYRSCGPAGDTFEVETWTLFPGGSGKQYRFTGGLASGWITFTSTISHHGATFIFGYAASECPDIAAPFSLSIRNSSGTDNAGGTVRPYWEAVSGALTL